MNNDDTVNNSERVGSVASLSFEGSFSFNLKQTVEQFVIQKYTHYGKSKKESKCFLTQLRDLVFAFYMKNKVCSTQFYQESYDSHW